MSKTFQLGRADLILLIINLICLGGLMTLLCIKGPTLPNVLLLIGTAVLALTKISRGWGVSTPRKPDG